MRVILAGRYLVHDSTTARWWIQIVVAEFLFRRTRLVDQFSFFAKVEIHCLLMCVLCGWAWRDLNHVRLAANVDYDLPRSFSSIPRGTFFWQTDRARTVLYEGAESC